MAKCNVKKYRKQKPYNADGKTNFRYTNKKSGVYIIYKNSKIVYIGFSGYNVYKTMYRHFQNWNDSSQIRISYKAKRKNHPYTVRVVLAPAKKAERLEKMLIIKHKPKDNPDKYLKYKPTQLDNKAIREFLGEKVESCPF